MKRRGSIPRARTIAPRSMRGAPVADLPPLPRTRGDCRGGERPCPHVRCPFHLALDVNPATGAIKVNFPHLDPTAIPETCSLDMADRGGITLVEVGEVLNLTRERVRQLEVNALRKLARRAERP